MATFKNAGILTYELVGDGTQPTQVIDPDGTVETDFNPNGMYFEWVEGDPPEGAGNFNPPEQIPPPADVEMLEVVPISPESPPESAAQPEE